jgi:hypothetical protein
MRQFLQVNKTEVIEINKVVESSIIVVDNYSTLPDPTTVSGKFYWCENSQGTKWTPETPETKGTYYPKGMYYSNGVSWSFIETPFQATQEEVDAGINNDKFVTPLTLNGILPTNTSQLINDGDDGLHPFISYEDLPSNVILYPTNVASDISGYFKMVTTIDDDDFNEPAVNISTGAVTTSNQLIAQLISVAGVVIGTLPIFNVSTVGNIRRTSGSGKAIFYFKIYKRDSLGVETLITTSNNTLEIENTVYEQFSASALWNNGTFTATDRIVIKYYGSKVGSGSNPTFDFQFGGQQPVRTLLPVPLSVIPIDLGFTPENVANKTTNIGNIDVNSYPNTPTVKSALDAKQDTLTNITQITTRSYNDLQDLPSAITNLNQITTRSYNDLQDLPSAITNLNQITTRSYNDLQDLPTIPSAITNLNQITTRSYNDLQDLPSAITNLNQITTRSYSDLQNIPFVEIIQNNLVSTTDTTTAVLLRTIPIGDISTFRRLEYNSFGAKGPTNTGNATYIIELHNITTNTTTTLGSHSNNSRYFPFSRTNIVILGGVLYYPTTNILTDTGTSGNQVSTLNITSGDLYELRFSAASGADNNLQNPFFYLKLTK